MKLIKWSLISVLLIITSACGGGNETNNLTDTTTTTKPPIDIIGEWGIGCINKKLEIYEFRSTTTMTGFVVDEYARENSDCNKGQVHYSTATYTIGKAFTTEDGVRIAYELDIKWAADPYTDWYGGDVLQLVYREGDFLYFGVTKIGKSRPTQIDDSKRFAIRVKTVQ